MDNERRGAGTAGLRMAELLKILGTCERRLFGITPAERLRRQRCGLSGPMLVADASAVLSDPAIAWLIENPGKVLTAPSGRPMAVAVDPADQEAAIAAIEGSGALPMVNPAEMAEVFIRKLRRRNRLFVRSFDEQPGMVRRELFANVYKGVTDLVTKYAWPMPAYFVTRALAALSIPPNAVTICGILVMFAAAWLWVEGQIAAGLACAWLMTFLDTVDGKLARVTATSSRLGNKLDHVTDMVHPPIWWVCLAVGIASHQPGASAVLLIDCTIILATYLVGRLVETAFKKAIGYNAYLWQRFDSLFRLVVARRNTILLIMTVGLIGGELVTAFTVSAIWSVISVAIQLTRFFQALKAQRSGRAHSWLM